ncbi:CoA pyrophosphatase [Microvirga antarctica]|uniref:CoA pyrophosphatase n=1 Tax=Microvirga antarctica TaxID=2819233 RepID=UPI001B31112E|nr:CoA pyrophosphatase [Microvirga antarctica]
MTQASSLVADFLDLTSRRLRREPPDMTDALANPRGDHTLDDVPLALPLRPKSAAVLVPVVMRENPTLLLTERSAQLRQHSGQIAFPGGRVDPTDASIADAAFREAEEEIGLAARHIGVLGYLDPYLSTTNYLVMPVVAEIAPDYTVHLNPAEVERAFEVPLDFVMDPSHHELHAREWKGWVRRFYAISYGEHYIWGVTAGIVRNLYERLYTS